jgi:hypothetical protein
VLYNSENWAIKARVSRTIKAAEIKYVRTNLDTLGWIAQQTRRLQKNEINPPILD